MFFVHFSSIFSLFGFLISYRYFPFMSLLTMFMYFPQLGFLFLFLLSRLEMIPIVTAAKLV